ncbi:hypothetical protein NBRC116493_35500 [Aurantivibrio infirmus]
MEMKGTRISISPLNQEPSLESLLNASPAGSFDLDEEDREWLETPSVGTDCAEG